MIYSDKTTPIKGKRKTVEEQLLKTTRLLIDTESNIALFSKMIKHGLSTNDVYNFVRNQSDLRKSSNRVDYKLMKNNMRQKLNDACSYATKLRQNRKALLDKLFKKHVENRTRARKVVEHLKEKSRRQKERNRKRDSEKYNHCKRKQQEDRTWEGIPEETKKIIRGVNIFKRKVTPEKPLGPMVCSEGIKLNENERAF